MCHSRLVKNKMRIVSGHILKPAKNQHKTHIKIETTSGTHSLVAKATLESVSLTMARYLSVISSHIKTHSGAILCVETEN